MNVAGSSQADMRRGLFVCAAGRRYSVAQSIIGIDHPKFMGLLGELLPFQNSTWLGATCVPTLQFMSMFLLTRWRAGLRKSPQSGLENHWMEEQQERVAGGFVSSRLDGLGIFKYEPWSYPISELNQAWVRCPERTWITMYGTGHPCFALSVAFSIHKYYFTPSKTWISMCGTGHNIYQRSLNWYILCLLGKPICSTQLGLKSVKPFTHPSWNNLIVNSLQSSYMFRKLWLNDWVMNGKDQHYGPIHFMYIFCIDFIGHNN